MEQGHGNDNNINNNNNIINSPSPPPPSTLTATAQTSTAPSTAIIATSSQSNYPIPYYVDIPPSQNTFQPIAPVGFPPPHNYWHNPPHLIPRRMYTTYNMDPGGPESRVFLDSFGKGKPLQYDHATHELMRHGLPDFVYSIPKLKPLGRSRAVPFLKEPVKQILLNPPVFRELEELGMLHPHSYQSSTSKMNDIVSDDIRIQTMMLSSTSQTKCSSPVRDSIHKQLKRK
jgi:hypothetical protein